MNAVLGLSLALAAPPGLKDQHSVWLWQGRASEVERAKQRADLCGLKKAEVAIMRGPELFHGPDEPGAELSIPASEMTEVAQRCMAKRRSEKTFF